MTPKPLDAPEIDPRSHDDVAREALRRLNEAVPEWAPPLDSATGLPVGPGGALVDGFAHLMALLVDRLNRAPDKNLLAFLDLLGASRTPPRPARVPLVFAPTRGGMARVAVPQGTRVSGEPPEDGGPAPVFETERRVELVVATLDTVGVRDPRSDRYSLVNPADEGLEAPLSPVVGQQPVPHDMYLRHDEILSTAADELRVEVELERDAFPADRWTVLWERWNGTGWAALRPALDGTHGLLRSGAVSFRDVEASTAREVHGVEGHWLRCRLETPIVSGSSPRANMVRERELPAIETIRLRQTVASSELEPLAAFADQAPLDASKDFLPFGATPGFGGTFYLAQDQAFEAPGGRVTLRVEMTNPATGRDDTPVPRVDPSSDLRLRWEAWSGVAWEEVGQSGPSDDGTGREGFEDGTRAFTRSGTVSFKLPGTTAPTEVNGVAARWIRVRIVAGDYGQPADYRVRRDEDDAPRYELVPETFAPPVLAGLTVARVVERVAVPHTVCACNDFDWRDGSSEVKAPDRSWRPFRAMSDREPTLYLGLNRAEGLRARSPRSVSLWFGVDAGAVGVDAHRDGGTVAWECSGPEGWLPVVADDETEGLRRSGSVRLLLPDDFATAPALGRRRHWLRAVVRGADDGDRRPRLSAVLHNAVWARQSVSVQDETVGSARGLPSHRFRTRLSPVLPGQQLLVRERGHDDPGGEPTWIAWEHVPDFHGSGPTDRHYVLDRMSGTITFGDGRHGATPPAGRGNVRISYRTGGGAPGNVPAGTVARLDTTVPYVAGVTNPVPARGGADEESVDEVRRRAPATLRHRDRAVTASDYEDLARAATTEVARARVLPHTTPSVDERPASGAAAVDLVVVPLDPGAAPLPDPGLLRTVRRYLDARRPPGVELRLQGPDYVCVDVEAALGIARPEVAGAVETEAVRTVGAFLHPLSGGPSGDGWPFGRLPRPSDLQAILARIPGVVRIESLRLSERAADGGTVDAADPRARLVCAGTVRVRLAPAVETER